MIQTTNNTSATIFTRALSAGTEAMSVELAEYLLKIKLDPVDAKRANELAEKSRMGALTSSEENEIEEYRRAGRMIETLKLRATKVVKSQP